MLALFLQQLEAKEDSNYDTEQIGSFFKTIAMWGAVLPGKINLLDRPRQDLSYQLFFALQIKSNVFSISRLCSFHLVVFLAKHRIFYFASCWNNN
jgi:hypothetical protein